MVRPLRVEYDGPFYYVMARGNKRSNIYSRSRRLEAEMGRDNNLNKRIPKTDLALSNVKGCPFLSNSTAW